MSNTKRKKRTNKKTTKRMSKALTLSLAVTPLVLAVPVIAGAAVAVAEHNTNVIQSVDEYVSDYVNSELGGSLRIGDSITVDLDEIFEDTSMLSYRVITYNSNVAAVTLLSGDLHIEAKHEGTTMVELIATLEEDGQPFGVPIYDHFQLDVAPIEDIGTSGINVDDVVHYLNEYPARVNTRSGIERLLQRINPINKPDNAAPTTNGTTFHYEVAPLNEITFDMDDFFHDPDGDSLTFQIASSGSITGLTLAGDQLTIDDEISQPSFRIIAREVEGSQGSAFLDFIINVAPTNITLNHSSIDENAEYRIIGQFTTQDLNYNDNFTYTLVGGAGDSDNSSFRISGNELEAISSFDFETKNSYSIRVRSSDEWGLFTEKTFTISVNDLYEAPNVAPQVNSENYYYNDEYIGLSMKINNIMTLDLSEVFMDMNDDELEYEIVELPDPEYGLASILEGDLLEIKALGSPSMQLTVKARDEHGALSGDVVIKVEIDYDLDSNLWLETNDLEDESITINLFDLLGFQNPQSISSIAYYDDDVVSVSFEKDIDNISEDARKEYVKITAIQKGITPITITTDIGSGVLISQELMVYVDHHKPEVNIEHSFYHDGYINVNMNSNSIITFDLAQVFMDSDGDEIVEYEVAYEADDIAASIDGNLLEIKSSVEGESRDRYFAIRALDENNIWSDSVYFRVYTEDSPESVWLYSEDEYGQSIMLCDLFDYDEEIPVTAEYNEDVISVDINDGRVDIEPIGSGVTPITITANLGSGVLISQEIMVFVDQHIPELNTGHSFYNEGRIELTTKPNNVMTLDLSEVFTDGDGDEIVDYEVAYEADDIMAYIDGGLLEITSSVEGEDSYRYLNVRALDQSNIWSDWETILVYTSITNVTSFWLNSENEDGESISLMDLFGYDGGNTGYTFTGHSQDENVASVNIIDGEVIIQPIQQGITSITITANLGSGVLISREIMVYVDHHKPQLNNEYYYYRLDDYTDKGYIGLSMLDSNLMTLELSELFIDEDEEDEIVEYEIVDYSGEELTAYISDGLLTIQGYSSGVMTVIIRARDDNGIWSDDIEIRMHIGYLYSSYKYMTIPKGQQNTLGASDLFGYSSEQVVSIAASSDNEDVAVIIVNQDEKNVSITGMEIGEATIYIELDIGHGVKVSQEIMVSVGYVD